MLYHNKSFHKTSPIIQYNVKLLHSMFAVMNVLYCLSKLREHPVQPCDSIGNEKASLIEAKMGTMFSQYKHGIGTRAFRNKHKCFQKLMGRCLVYFVGKRTS